MRHYLEHNYIPAILLVSPFSDFTTPLLFAQRVSPQRFVGINTQFHKIPPIPECHPRRARTGHLSIVMKSALLVVVFRPMALLCRAVFFHQQHAHVKIRPRKACKCPNLKSFGWASYDKVGVLYSGKLGSRSEARASDLGSYPGLWWKRIKLHLYEGTKVSTLRGPAQLADPWGTIPGSGGNE